VRGGGRPVALIAAGAGLVAALGWSTDACAYVRKLTDGGIPEYWQQSCTSATVYLNGFTMLSRDEGAEAVAGAAHAWSPEAITCPDGSHPYFEIAVSIDPDPNAGAGVANDHRNVIVFETRDDARDSQTFVDPTMNAIGKLAVTSATPKADGRILDADLRVNATTANPVDWANLDPNATTHFVDAHDLQSVLTHEFGHFLGLDHTCYQSTTTPPPLDDMGNPIPNCGSAPPAVQDTVMWYAVGAGVVKRVLTDDEVRAMCAIYPAASDPHNCGLDRPDDGFGYSMAATSPSSAAGVLGALAALALSRRRARCARRAPTPRRA